MTVHLDHPLPLRIRQRGVYTICVATALGVFGAGLNYAVTGGAGPVEPWRIGCLLAVLGLWSWAAMDGSALAHVRTKGALSARFGQAFAYGYFLCAALVLMQLGALPLERAWFTYGCAGLIFGAMLAYLPVNEDKAQANVFFEDTHALHRGLLPRALFLVWPAVSVALMTSMVLQPAQTALPTVHIAVLMVLFAAIWPLPFDIKPAFRAMFMGLMSLGLALLGLVLLVP